MGSGNAAAGQQDPRNNEAIISDMMAHINIPLEKYYRKFTANPDIKVQISISEVNYRSMKETIGYLKDFMMDKMLPLEYNSVNEKQYLDAHKLAAISTLTILTCRPFVKFNRDHQQEPVPICNEILALEVAIEIISSFQVYDYCEKRFASEQEFVRKYPSVMGEFTNSLESSKYPFPPQISDVPAIEQNLIWAMHYYSTDYENANFKSSAWLFSHIFYFIDLYSRPIIEKMVEQIIVDLYGEPEC